MDLSPPRGTDDLLPPRSERVLKLAEEGHRAARLYGYRYVETPAFEATELFARAAGETSDVVRKEMYTFEDRGGRSLTLRPEGTAPVVRAYLRRAHELPEPFKGYYVEGMWRYGRPQAGRLREFRHFGIEVLGTAAPAADVEVIAVGHRYLTDVGLAEFGLEVNSIGDESCRPAYRQLLIEYLDAQAPRLRDEHRERYRDNPLRVLDCKDPACRDVALDAPKITDHLCGPCKDHFDAVLSGLEREGLDVNLVPTLVRGLDYYTRTAFEYVSPRLPEGQASVGGGGRYDGLAELLGGPPTPGVGFAMGIDRIGLALEKEGGGAEPPPALECFVVAIGEGTRDRADEIARTLRAVGVATATALEPRPLKAQLRMADRSGARFAVIVGDREVEEGTATVRRLADGHQEAVPVTDVSAWIAQQA